MLRVYFFNVGHGECTLIEHASGRLTMVDINTSHEYDWNTQQELIEEQRKRRNLGLFVPSGLLEATIQVEAKTAAAGELTDPIDFLLRNYPRRSLFRFILTHPDLDHMRGLKRLRETIGFANFWDTSHTKETPDFRGDNDREEWQHYQQLRAGAFGHTTHYYARGDRYFAFAKDEAGNDGGDGIEIISPTDTLVKSCNAAKKSNDLSYALRIWYLGKSIMLTGDIEEEAWNNIVAAYGSSLKSDILQASHHGRDSGYHLRALQLIKPDAVIVSVGRRPDTDASRKYAAQGANVWSTRRFGTLTLNISNSGTINWTCERNGS